jgi:hypothetical protein
LGKLLRDKGQSRLPEPPQSRIGVIGGSLMARFPVGAAPFGPDRHTF